MKPLGSFLIGAGAGCWLALLLVMAQWAVNPTPSLRGWLGKLLVAGMACLIVGCEFRKDSDV